MSRYVLIESRDPFESRDTLFVTDLAAALKRSGNDVTVFLVQNGVLAARAAARCSQLSELVRSGVTLLADDFSLRERGIFIAELTSGIRGSDIEALVELLVRENTKAIWH